MKRGLYLTGGTARGARLFSVPGDDVRPATARMRISVFEILRARLEGARVVDLFAGNGTLGFEALSRGALRCTFLDTDPRAVECLRRNAEKLKVADRARIVHGSAFDARLPEDVDIAFVDPPYALYDDAGTRAKLEAAAAGLPGRPLVVAEHRALHDLGESWAGRRRTDRRSYGGTHVAFYE